MWQDGDIATFNHPTRPEKGKQVAIRRDYGWEDGQWQVAIHGFWRVTDEFITEYGTRMVPAGE
jgi:hypothetical protein